MKIAQLAELHQVRTGCHGATDLSPVCMAAALHFDLSVHNFGIQEHMPHSEATDRVFPHAYTFERGFMHPGDAPGLGVDIDEALAAEYPYVRAYLPVNRRLDGTVHTGERAASLGIDHVCGAGTSRSPSGVLEDGVRTAVFASAMLLGVVASLAAQAGPAARVEVVRKEADRRVDVLVDGKPFTSYIWPTTLKKPVLFPIRTAKGTLVTRGFPLEPRAGERVDHPHHVGLWFNYGDVNGIDFWNNSDAIPAGRQAQDGHGSPPRHHGREGGRRSRRARHELRLGDAGRLGVAQAEHVLHVPRRSGDSHRSTWSSPSPRRTSASR